jgi:ribosomal protein L7/L12
MFKSTDKVTVTLTLEEVSTLSMLVLQAFVPLVDGDQREKLVKAGQALAVDNWRVVATADVAAPFARQISDFIFADRKISAIKEVRGFANQYGVAYGLRDSKALVDEWANGCCVDCGPATVDTITADLVRIVGGE